MQRRVSAFGNNHSPAINRGYRRYHERARAMFGSIHPDASVDPAILEVATSLHRDGSLNLPSDLTASEASELKSLFDAAFEDRKNVYPVSKGLYRLMDGAEYFRPLIDIFTSRAADIVEQYFGSYFKIYSITIYRTVPDDSVPESSFLWHFDNCPDQQLKAMIYLDEVSEATGAFRFKSKNASEKARSLGFWHRDDYELGRSVFEDDSGTTVVEGGPGTVTLFQPGRVVHKATAPREEHRDVAVLVLNPSLHHWREHLSRNRHLLSTNAGLCLDLDTDEPENIGYRF